MSYENDVLLLPLNGVNGGTSFPDYSRHNRTITAFGNAQTSTAQSKFYGSSALFDGTGDRLDTGATADLNTLTVWTIDAWIRVVGTGTSRAILSTTVPGNGWQLYRQFGDVFYFYFEPFATGTKLIGTTTILENAWYHVAVCRNGGTIRLFVDGAQEAISSSINQGSANTQTIRVSGQVDGTTQLWNGYIQDVRITLGTALYTTNFTPPDKLIAPVAGTLTDDAGAPAERRIWVIPRAAQSRVFSGLSDPGDGSYSIDAPNVECARIVLDDAAGTQHNDLIDRVDVAA